MKSWLSTTKPTRLRTQSRQTPRIPPFSTLLQRCPLLMMPLQSRHRPSPQVQCNVIWMMMTPSRLIGTVQKGGTYGTTVRAFITNNTQVKGKLAWKKWLCTMSLFQGFSHKPIHQGLFHHFDCRKQQNQNHQQWNWHDTNPIPPNPTDTSFKHTRTKVSFACDASFQQVATIMPGIVTQGKMEDDDLSNNQGYAARYSSQVYSGLL